jgi:hypothetical protein
MGIPAVLKISGGMMPVYVAVLAVKDQITSPITQTTYANNSTTFMKAAIPDYHLTGATPTPIPAAKVGDINRDGVINVFDLSILLTKWNTAAAEADLNGDGTVNVFDLSTLLSHWGT